MRDFIACLFIWLGEPLRQRLRTLHRRASSWLSPPPPPSASPGVLQRPTYDRDPLPDHVLALRMPFDGHAVSPARPYYIASEFSLRSAEAVQLTNVWWPTHAGAGL